MSREIKRPGLKEFYEVDALRHNIWNENKRTTLYFKEMLRYTKILALVEGAQEPIIDLGAGDGYLSHLLAQRNHRVVALDISENRLAKFRDRVKSANIDQLLGDVQYLPFAEDSFSCVIASELMEHLPDYERALREIHRILKTSGTMVLSVPYKENLAQHTCPHCLNSFYVNGHLHSFDEDKITAVLVRIGFKIEKRVLFRNIWTERMQRYLRLPFGKLLIAVDGLTSKVFRNGNLYLAVRARKVRQRGRSA